MDNTTQQQNPNQNQNQNLLNTTQHNTQSKPSPEDELKIKQAFEKIKSAQIKLFSRSPFFSFLSLHLKIKRSNGELPPWAMMGVNLEGTLYFKEQFINEMKDEQVMGVICHEILHLGKFDLSRRKNRNPDKWNIVCDLTVNSLLKKNGFDLPEKGLIPSGDEFTFPPHFFGKKVVIKDINKKIAEQIYDELPELKDNDSGNGSGGEGERWDLHDEKGTGDGKEGKEGDGTGTNYGKRQLTSAEMKELEEKWKEWVEEAILTAKSRGSLPAGFERYFDEIKKAQVNWRGVLERFIQKGCPTDQDWSRRSKKSVACKTYLPSSLQEKVNVVVVIDVSGSIGQKELVDFVSEIVGISRAYQRRVDMKLITHDAEVHDDYEIKNGNIEKLKKITIHGGGGTEFNCVPQYLKEKYKNTTKCVIWLTDGCGTTIDNKTPYPILWVLTKDGMDDVIKNRQIGDKIIWLKN
jgi:predicted metal-dependent peptidase